MAHGLKRLATAATAAALGRLTSSSCGTAQELSFGILFDIDGVLVRGKRVLPFAQPAFRLLVDPADGGRFRVPSLFVTNAGNSMRKTKAAQLSDWLGVEVSEDQVVMSHSPLRLFTEYHNRHVLVVGQGPVREIASQLGFKSVTTVEQLRHAFPSLDAVDHKRRRAAPCAFESFFPRLDAVVLFGEPTRWETSLQLLVDVLVTDGLPALAPQSFPYPHLPVLACNMDLQWMAEAVLPRFGHGAFLASLEHLYKKITGRDLVYTALVGKPSEITYRHSEMMLQEQAKDVLGLSRPIKHIYCIGDNIFTDIFGANLYNKYLQDCSKRQDAASRSALSSSRSIDHLLEEESDHAEFSNGGAERCLSMLVETGVYSTSSKSNASLDHSPRDFLPVEESFLVPTHVVGNVLEAVELIFKLEGFTQRH